MIQLSWIGMQDWVRGARNFDKQFGKRAEDEVNRILEDKALPLATSIVHVITGQLQASGVVVPMRFDGQNIEGGLEYGNDFVDYAPFEFARGGEHDWLTPTANEILPLLEEALGTAFTKTIDAWN